MMRFDEVRFVPLAYRTFQESSEKICVLKLTLTMGQGIIEVSWRLSQDANRRPQPKIRGYPCKPVENTVLRKSYSYSHKISRETARSKCRGSDKDEEFEDVACDRTEPLPVEE